MDKARSRDGTLIAYERRGAGPAVIIVTGALCDRVSARPLAAALAPHLRVFAYDRRGRGDSGDTQPFAVEREIEDIDALIDEAGESAFVYGHSSGACLALDVKGQVNLDGDGQQNWTETAMESGRWRP
jgi:pimeloyl-ACP methyl ester carboxylesterase